MPTDPIQHLSIPRPAVPGVPSTAAPPSVRTTPATPAALPPAAALRAARRNRAALLHEIHLLEAAVAAPVRDPGWRRRLGNRLTGLRTAFAEHMDVTEGTDGLYAELLDHAPRLARGVHLLIREHAAVVATLAVLQHRVGLPETSTVQVRSWATDLLRELSRHRQHGADLVYEAYQTDIGGET
ncbi:hypothetical protein [Plantactinospora sonchi]|uniref:Hemerythrin-like domain-containing protein n=1 Tax=Plantactinospora sonchi TaxID=1544735 RepID=A0ABU7RLH6_9ACTN